MAGERPLRIMAAGDIMLGDSSHFLGRGVGSCWSGRDDFQPLGPVADLLDQADVFLANLESPLSTVPGANSWERVYRAPAAAASCLRRGERTVLSLANNHILEHGAGLLDETRSVLDAHGIGHAGLAADGSRRRATHRWQQGGFDLVFHADSLIRDISGRRVDQAETEAWLLAALSGEKADVRIVSLHWGDEYIGRPSPGQRDLARRLIDAGAHVVLGHHPHVLQPVEEYGHGLIAYSLGNFLFDQDWTAETRQGGILDLTVDRTGVVAWRFHPTVCDAVEGTRHLTGPAIETVRQTIGGDPVLNDADYAADLRTASRRHRLRMKLELLRHFWRVSPDTIHFLLTKRRRPRPDMSGSAGEGDR